MRTLSDKEYSAMMWDHASRAWDLVNDQVLARAVLARGVRSSGKRFIYASEVR